MDFHFWANCSFRATNLPCLVPSVSASLPLVYKSCSRSQWRHQVFFPSSLLHLIPMRKQTFLSYRWKTPWLESQLSACTACVISDQSHIINTAFLYLRWRAGSTVFTFRRFHTVVRWEVTSPSTEFLIPHRTLFLCHAHFKPFFYVWQKHSNLPH